jgi:sarcosine oxidase subunit beta
MIADAAAVKGWALELGFLACGIARPDPSARAGALDRWLAAGYGGTMRYIHRQAKKRKNPGLIDAKARSIVVILDNYYYPDPAGAESPHRIAKYARGNDYHDVIAARLGRLADRLLGAGARVARVYSDTGPVPERELAERAGLGWIGKNTMLIRPGAGSFTFIGSIFTDLELAPDEPLAADLCGTCTRCLDACPTAAFVEPRLLDATRCISYLTIEQRGPIPDELAARLDGWAFGCDVCNDVCPWNRRFATESMVAGYRPRTSLAGAGPEHFERMDEDEFARRYGDTPLARPGLAGMRRNFRAVHGSRDLPAPSPAHIQEELPSPGPRLHGMTSASVVVIGGGIIGASVAFHLAQRGWRDILVLDAARAPGEGSTGRATGGYRAQYATPVNVALSLLARAKLLRFRDEVGADPGYAPAGYLWLAGSDAELRVLRAGLPVQHAAGLTESAEVGLDEVRRINPALAPDGIAGGMWCPSDGFIRPLDMLHGYLSAAARLGARIDWGRRVTGFRRDASGRITAVETPAGPVAAGEVVNAAGAWAAPIAALAGIDLPVTPLRRQAVPTHACDLLPPDMPMTIYAGDGFHLRVRDRRVLLLWPTPGVPDDPHATRVDPEWIDAVTAMAHARVPVLRGASIDRAGAWGGLYEVTPDKHAILGAAPACPNLHFANGSSGHGVMHAPALGHLLAEMLSGEPPSVDVRPLRFSRFAEGEPNPVSELL